MKKEFRSCECGKKLDYLAVKGGGRPPKYCPPCRIASDKRTDAKNSRIAAEILEHITRRFRAKFRVVGTPNAQMFLATLWEEIRTDPLAINVHFRRALTSPFKNQFKNKQTLASYLGAFSKVHRGLYLGEILVTKPLSRERKAKMEAAERDARSKSDVGDEFVHYSPVGYLLEGYELPKLKVKKSQKQVEEQPTTTAKVIPFSQLSETPSLTEAILNHLRVNHGRGISSLVGTRKALKMKFGFDEDAVTAEMHLLCADGCIECGDGQLFWVIAKAA